MGPSTRGRVMGLAKRRTVFHDLNKTKPLERSAMRSAWFSAPLLCRCSGCLQNNAEQALFVETSQVRAERLGRADQGKLPGNGPGKRAKAPIGVHVVNDDGALRRQAWPGSIQLEPNVTLTMQAIVNEQVDLTQVGKQFRETAPARALDVCPSIRVAFAHSGSDLLAPRPLQGRKINAPKMAAPIPLKCLKNETGRDAVSDPGLDNVLRFQVTRQTPDGSHQSGIAIVPPLKALGAGSYPLCFQLAYHLLPDLPKLPRVIAGPSHSEDLMKLLFPACIRLVGTLRSAPLALSDVGLDNSG